MSNKRQYSSIERRFAAFLAKIAPRLKEDVDRAFRQWNNVVRDHLRTETGLRLTVGNESQAVPVHIEDGLPKAFAQAIESSDEGTWALLLRSVVNFSVFPQKWPKLRHSSPEFCSSRSIFTNVTSALQGF